MHTTVICKCSYKSVHPFADTKVNWLQALALPTLSHKNKIWALYLQEVWVFHQIVVEDEVVADGSQAQVQDCSSEVRHHQQADNLPQGSVFRPRRWVHVRREEVVVSDIQHKIHGWICKNTTKESQYLYQSISFWECWEV